jgi:hypothetical protein
MYVGRSNGLRQRHGRHCRPGATYKQAAFAFQLAREKTGRTKVAYKAGEDHRKGLMLNPDFAAAIQEAKARIRAMEYRYVEETAPIRQALLEIYCAVALASFVPSLLVGYRKVYSVRCEADVFMTSVTPLRTLGNLTAPFRYMHALQNGSKVTSIRQVRATCADPRSQSRTGIVHDP